ncbi:branched-chain amino acid ABC transporter permease [Thermus antranikianii]|uniref:Branched-chain amino acid ABC transporter permease n=1 Tax=Thermus antranikianii TaxID=88190 RepID=A0ABY7RPU1_9DEIN|nr:branched-chain amino acid ABC transporter permease [Thermus antranikianii]QWK21530.1 MAG: branched-chain amino acid ABC transporter permease [Thermus antranikianii]WCM39712.1 branched-chain amino acid ABC transporter permease [Thermus antranikianii]
MKERLPILILFAGLSFLPLFLDDYLRHLLITALVLALLALSWNILGGFAGQISFGHAAFFGLGAYGAGILAKNGFNPWLALFLGSGIALLGGAIALPTLRLRGPYFALAMLAYAEVLRTLAILAENLTGGAAGLFNIPALHLAGIDLSAKLPNFYIALVLLVLGTSVTFYLRYGPLGLGLAALHEEEAAQAGGVPVFRLKALALFASAGLAGLAGAFQALYIRFLEPPYAFSPEWSIYPLVAALLGGKGTVVGPILGTFGLYLGAELVVKQLLERGYHILTGLLVVLVILFLRRGLFGFLEDRYATLRPKH